LGVPQKSVFMKLKKERWRHKFFGKTDAAIIVRSIAQSSANVISIKTRSSVKVSTF
jgi:hypothetical protein